jgi:hypothetical protein
VADTISRFSPSDQHLRNRFAPLVSKSAIVDTSPPARPIKNGRRPNDTTHYDKAVLAGRETVLLRRGPFINFVLPAERHKARRVAALVLSPMKYLALRP